MGLVIGTSTVFGRSEGPGPQYAPPNLQISSVQYPIAFQGVLTDGEGNPVEDAKQSVTFSIYSTADPARPLWQEPQVIVTSNGAFRTLLGTVTPIEPAVFAQLNEAYLGIQVGTDLEMTPRLRLAYTPFTINAALLGDLPGTQYAKLTDLTGLDGATLNGLSSVDFAKAGTGG